MKQHIFLLAAMAALGVVSGHRDQSIGAEGAQVSPAMSFFVSSTGSKTVNLGGLRGADKLPGAGERSRSRQQDLARLLERRAGSRQWQQADRRAQSNRHWSLVECQRRRSREGS
jgi:hypothetical protein